MCQGLKHGFRVSILALMDSSGGVGDLGLSTKVLGQTLMDMGTGAKVSSLVLIDPRGAKVLDSASIDSGSEHGRQRPRLEQLRTRVQALESWA